MSESFFREQASGAKIASMESIAGTGEEADEPKEDEKVPFDLRGGD